MRLSRVLFALVLAAGLRVPVYAADSPPIVSAVKSGNIDTVRSLLAKRGDPNAAEVDGTTALHWAAHFDNVAGADLLIKAGAKAQSTNRYGITPLWLACINGSSEMVELLLNAGADPNTKMPEGDTALMTAARTGKPAAVKALIARGANVNAVENWKGQTALMWAAAANSAQVVQALVEAGADIQARTKFKPVAVGGPGGFGTSGRAQLGRDQTGWFHRSAFRRARRL